MESFIAIDKLARKVTIWPLNI